MRQLKNGRFVIAIKPDRRDPEKFQTVLAADTEMSQYVIWTERLDDAYTFGGDYFDSRVWHSNERGFVEASYLAFLDAVAAFRER